MKLKRYEDRFERLPRKVPLVFEITNEQRECLGLPPLLDSWKKITAKEGIYDHFATYLYADGQKIKRVILYAQGRVGFDLYREYEIDASLTEDGSMLMAKTDRGKPVPITSANVLKHKPTGMVLHLNYQEHYIYNSVSGQYFYRSAYDDKPIYTVRDFERWLKRWCKQITPDRKAELAEFITRGKMIQKYKEGDFFRFRFDEHQYGYGRIIVDYGRMRKNGTPFWNIIRGDALCVAVYHIVTEDKHVPLEELEKLSNLPAILMEDTTIRNGELEIIGNLPITRWSDYPILYGLPRDENGVEVKGFCYQRGKTFICRYDDLALYDAYTNHTVHATLNVSRPIVDLCIIEKSNQVYWDMYEPEKWSLDLRNPKNIKQLRHILACHCIV